MCIPDNFLCNLYFCLKSIQCKGQLKISWKFYPRPTKQSLYEVLIFDPFEHTITESISMWMTVLTDWKIFYRKVTCFNILRFIVNTGWLKKKRKKKKREKILIRDKFIKYPQNCMTKNYFHLRLPVCSNYFVVMMFYVGCTQPLL